MRKGTSEPCGTATRVQVTCAPSTTARAATGRTRHHASAAAITRPKAAATGFGPCSATTQNPQISTCTHTSATTATPASARRGAGRRVSGGWPWLTLDRRLTTRSLLRSGGPGSSVRVSAAVRRSPRRRARSSLAGDVAGVPRFLASRQRSRPVKGIRHASSPRFHLAPRARPRGRQRSRGAHALRGRSHVPRGPRDPPDGLPALGLGRARRRGGAGPCGHRALPAGPRPTARPWSVPSLSVIGIVGYAAHQALFLPLPTLLEGDRAEMAALYERQGQTAESGILIFLVFLIPLFLGLTLLGISAYRAGTAPLWPASPWSSRSCRGSCRSRSMPVWCPSGSCSSVSVRTACSCSACRRSGGTPWPHPLDRPRRSTSRHREPDPTGSASVR